MNLKLLIELVAIPGQVWALVALIKLVWPYVPKVNVRKVVENFITGTLDAVTSLLTIKNVVRVGDRDNHPYYIGVIVILALVGSYVVASIGVPLYFLNK